MFDWYLVSMITTIVVSILFIVFGLYYRSLWISALEELADKKAILSAVINHSEEQEKSKVKKVSKSKPVEVHTIIKRKTTKK